MAMQLQVIAKSATVKKIKAEKINRTMGSDACWFSSDTAETMASNFLVFMGKFTLLMVALILMGCVAKSTINNGFISEQDLIDIKDLMQVIDNANRMKFEHDGIFTDSVNELINLNYLAIDSAMNKQFDLMIYINDSQHRLVEARSKGVFPGGPGWIFQFDPIKQQLTIQFRR